ncbi:MAG: hypothetical protein AAB541_03145 [Patescibacteria group bacterium]
MTPLNHRKTSRKTMVLLAIILALVLFAITDKGQAQAAPLAAANRCRPIVTESSFAYHCWAAYPEGFSLSGHVSGTFRFDWRVTCDGRSVSGSKTDGGVVHVYAGILSRTGKVRAAYELMASHDVCKIDMVGRPVASNGSIQLIEFFVNRNDPLPIVFHN